MYTAGSNARTLLLVLSACIAGCANQSEPLDKPSMKDLKGLCPAGTTLACVERMREPVRCFCSDRDTLREPLEPTVE